MRLSAGSVEEAEMDENNKVAYCCVDMTRDWK
jgi:hypothetical protein